MIVNSLEQMTYTFYDELITATRSLIFHLPSIYGTSKLRDRTVGTVSNADGEFALENQGNGDVTILDTAERGPYASNTVGLPGAGVRLPGEPTGSTNIDIGYFGDVNGFYYSYRPDGLYAVVLRKTVPQESFIGPWNAAGLISPSNNSGAAAFDPKAGYIYQIPYAWYAFGPSRFLFQLKQQNKADAKWMQLLHEFRPDGQTSIADPHQPIRVRVTSGAGDPPYTAYVGGRQYSIIGEYVQNPRETVIEHDVTGVGPDAWVPAFSVKRKNVSPYALTKIGSLGIRAAADIRVLIELEGSDSSGTYGDIPDYDPAETLLEVNLAPGGLPGEGNATTIRKLQFEAGTRSDPGTGGKALERLPMIEDVNLKIYVRRFDGETGDVEVNVSATMLEDW